MTAAFRYEHWVDLPAETTIGSVQTHAEFLRGHGRARVIENGAGGIEFSIEAADLWDLREVLAEIEQHFAAYGIDWTPERAQVIADAS